MIRKGNILGKFARYDEAVSCYDKALRLDPGNILALINKGLALHYLNLYDEAIACYDKALEERPHNATALYNRASSLALQKRHKECTTDLKKAIDEDISFKYKARADLDFASLREDEEFIRLVS